MAVISYTYINAYDTIILLQILQFLLKQVQLCCCCLLKCSLAFASHVISISLLCLKYSRYANKLKLNRNTTVLAVSLVKIMILEKTCNIPV